MQKVFILFSIILFTFAAINANATNADSMFLKANQSVISGGTTAIFQIKTIDSLRKMYSDEVIFDAFQKTVVGNTPFDFSNEVALKSYIRQAEILNSSVHYIERKSNLYQAMGDLMLQTLADTLDKVFIAKPKEANAPFMVYLIARLADNQKFIDVREGNLHKTVRYLKEGRYAYVFRKLTTTYLNVFLPFFLAMVSFFLMLIFRKRIVRSVNPRHWPISSSLTPAKYCSSNICAMRGCTCPRTPQHCNRPHPGRHFNYLASTTTGLQPTAPSTPDHAFRQRPLPPPTDPRLNTAGPP